MVQNIQLHAWPHENCFVSGQQIPTRVLNQFGVCLPNSIIGMWSQVITYGWRMVEYITIYTKASRSRVSSIVPNAIGQ